MAIGTTPCSLNDDTLVQFIYARALRVVTSDDCPQDFDMLGFAAIGSGAQTALASLAFARDHNALFTIQESCEVASHVLAAKFTAESASDVGQDTFYVCNSPGGFCQFLSTDKGGVEAVRKAWHQFGAPKRSPETVQLIRELTFDLRGKVSTKVEAPAPPDDLMQLASQTLEGQQ
jgi:hypothetical protein